MRRKNRLASPTVAEFNELVATVNHIEAMVCRLLVILSTQGAITEKMADAVMMPTGLEARQVHDPTLL